MTKLIFTSLLFVLSLGVFSQKIENVISSFAKEECVKYEALNEDEWKFAKYVFSKIDPPFYNLEQSEQVKDTINSIWFNKAFTYNDNGYSLDLGKIKLETSRINISDIPDVNDFVFIGMKMPMLEKAKSITSLEMNNCSTKLTDKFRKEFENIKTSYEVLVSEEENNEINLIMKNQGDSFTEIILFSQDGKSSIHCMWLKGAFDITDIAPPKDYNE